MTAHQVSTIQKKEYKEVETKMKDELSSFMFQTIDPQHHSELGQKSLTREEAYETLHHILYGNS